MKEKIKTLANEYYEEILSIYKHLHRHPELSFHEKDTAAFIEQRLCEYGIPYKKYATNGIVGVIEGSGEGKTIGLRADMDALPVNENSSSPYCSVNKGVMHACGHDVHMSCLLGAARILKETENHLRGRILLIFQPAEEMLPGGAKQMIEDGAFDEYQPDWIAALHCEPSMNTGHTGFRKGMYMASGDEIYITVRSEGGHAAMPHKTADSILIASHIIVALQQISSRHCPPAIPNVLTFGKIVGAGAVNIIPEEVKIEGTFRTMNEEWRAKAKKLITNISVSIAESMGGKCEVNIIDGYPFLKNEEVFTEKAMQYTKELLGEDNVHNLDIRMTTEDFGYYSQLFNTTFFRLGVKDGEPTHKLHTSKFLPDEKAIKEGMAILSWLAYSMGK